MKDEPTLLRCRTCGGTDYRPIACLVLAPWAPCGVDAVNAPRFQCMTCQNIVDIYDKDSVEACVTKGSG